MVPLIENLLAGSQNLWTGRSTHIATPGHAKGSVVVKCRAAAESIPCRHGVEQMVIDLETYLGRKLQEHEIPNLLFPLVLSYCRLLTSLIFGATRRGLTFGHPTACSDSLEAVLRVLPPAATFRRAADLPHVLFAFRLP